MALTILSDLSLFCANEKIFRLFASAKVFSVKDLAKESQSCLDALLPAGFDGNLRRQVSNGMPEDQRVLNLGLRDEIHCTCLLPRARLRRIFMDPSDIYDCCLHFFFQKL